MDTAEKLKTMIQEKYSAEQVKESIAANQFIPLYSREIVSAFFDTTQ